MQLKALFDANTKADGTTTVTCKVCTHLMQTIPAGKKNRQSWQYLALHCTKEDDNHALHMSALVSLPEQEKQDLIGARYGEKHPKRGQLMFPNLRFPATVADYVMPDAVKVCVLPFVLVWGHYSSSPTK